MAKRRRDNKRGKILVFLAGAFFVLLLTSFTSANFVCGEVNSSVELSSYWFDVMIHYPENPEEYTSCKISPEGGKYCCDPEDIKGVSWDIGKEINAKIFEKGYVAGPVSLTISGEGYDIFPEMQLKKIVTVHEPNKSVYFNITKIIVNVSSLPEFNHLSYSLNNSKGYKESEICGKCNNAKIQIENLSFGKNILKIIAADENGQRVIESKEFSILESINFERKIECKGCQKKKIMAGSKVNITVYLNLSHDALGTLIDYFPIDWQYLGKENIESYSETHNLIKWEVDGKNMEKTYTLTTPNTTITKRYTFKSEFEFYKSKEDKIVLFKFYKYLPWPKSFSQYKNKYHNLKKEINYLDISPSNPSVLFLKDSLFESVVLFPNESIKGMSNLIFLKIPPRSNFNQNFIIETNIESNKINKILITFKIKKPSWSILSLKSVKAYHHDIKDNSLKLLQIEKYDEDENFLYYEMYAQNKGTFNLKKRYRLNLFQWRRK